MTILYDIPLRVGMEEIILNQGGDISKRKPNERLVGLNQGFLKEVIAAAKPAAIYDVYKVERVTGDRIYLGPKDYFESKVLTNFMGENVRELVLCAYTVGKEIDDLIADRNRDGSGYDSFLLDGVANAALGSVGRYVISKVADYAREQGFDASTHVSPGQADWGVEQQKVLFRLLPAEKIGISLNDKNLMFPLKSTTVVIGIGEGVTKPEEGSACDYCKLNATCPQRKVRKYFLDRLPT